MKNYLFRLALLMLCTLSTVFAIAQTVTLSNLNLSGYTGANGVGGTSSISFVVENNSGTDYLLTSIDLFMNTANNGAIHTLWYSSTSISGPPQVTAPVWTTIATGLAIPATANGPQNVLSNLTHIIPASTTHRFVVSSTNGIRYSGPTPVPTPSIVSNSGLNLYAGNHTINGQVVGYGGGFPNPLNTPRWFTGALTLEAANFARNNAGIVAAPSPGGAICGNNNDITASFRNSGEVPLTSVNLNWHVNPVSGSPAVGSITWNGNLLPGDEITDYPIGTFSPGFSAGDVLHVYTSLPNGVPDSASADDSLMYILRGGFSGVFKVGGANPDFFTVQDAARFLDSLGAVCDTVIFDIRDGDYFGRWSIRDINNASFNAPIIFRSESGNPDLVRIIDTTSNNTASNHLGFLNGVDHISFENITFLNQSPNANFKRTIRISNSSDYVSFIGCKFQNNLSPTSNSVNVNSALVFSDSASVCLGASFVGCEFLGSNFGLLWLGGTKDNPGSGMRVENCLFKNQSAVGARIFNEQLLTFNRNVIYSENPSGVNSSIGFQGVNLTRGLKISNNQIVAESNFPRTGMHIRSTNLANPFLGNIPGLPSIIENNFIKVGIDTLSNDFTAVRLENLAFFNVVHNSIAVYGASTDNAALKVENGGAVQMHNNIFAAMNFGAAIIVDFDGVSPFAGEGNNNYFSLNSNFGVYDGASINNLVQWQSASNGGVNSVSVNPEFYSPIDLHVCADALSNAGNPNFSNLVDIDGEIRNKKTPDIGADEFESIATFSLGGSVNLCPGDSVLVNGKLNFDATFAWSDNFPDAQRWISSQGTYTASSTSQCGTAAATLQVDFIDLQVLGNDTSLCDGVSLTLEALLPGAKVTWFNGSNANSVDVDQTGLYYVEILDSNNCRVLDSIRVLFSIPVSLPNDTSFCDGNNIFLTANAGSGSYLWNTNETSRSILVNQSGTYEVTHTNNIGCMSAAEINVDVVPIPEADFTFSEVFGTILFQNISVGGANYIWDFGNGFFSNIENPIHVYNNDSTYNVTLNITNECGTDFITKQVVTTVASIENIDSDRIQIFPNPSSRVIFIQGLNVGAMIEIFDINGKKVFQQISQSDINSIDIESLTKGIYILQITTQDGIFRKKIVKN